MILYVPSLLASPPPPPPLPPRLPLQSQKASASARMDLSSTLVVACVNIQPLIDHPTRYYTYIYMHIHIYIYVYIIYIYTQI